MLATGLKGTSPLLLVADCIKTDPPSSVGYVEFKGEESVAAALQLRNSESSGHPNSVPFHRLYVGNIHFSITETDLQNVFEPFGELEFVQLQKDDSGRSRGYGFVQYVSAFPLAARSFLNICTGSAMLARPVRRLKR